MVLGTLMAVLATSAVAVGSASATTAVTLYVSQAGTSSTGCTGTGTSACATISDAVTAAEALAGDDVTIDVAASATPYADNITITNADAQLDLEGIGTGTVINGTKSALTVFTEYASNVIINNITIENGSSGSFGGDIEDEGTLSLTHDTITKGSGGDYGGGVYVSGGSLTATNDTFSDNYAYFGGAVANYGGATLIDDTFTGDSATEGAGIYNASGRTITVTKCTFNTEIAVGDGGAMRNDGSATLTNSTFYKDAAGANYSGGAIYVDGTSSVTTLNDDTLDDDTAGLYGPGIFIYADNTFTVGNSILNAAACSRVGGTNAITDAGYNVESDNTCGFGGSSKIDSSTIGLASALAANGSSGPSTLALAPTSSAINVVPSGSCTVSVDERGDARPGLHGSTSCDAGAYEYQTPLTSAPSAPQKLLAKPGVGLITLSWSAPASTGNLAISSYHAYCSTAASVSTTGKSVGAVKGTIHSMNVTKLKARTHYYCVVTASNSAGTSPSSNRASTTTKA